MPGVRSTTVRLSELSRREGERERGFAIKGRGCVEMREQFETFKRARCDLHSLGVQTGIAEGEAGVRSASHPDAV